MSARERIRWRIAHLLNRLPGQCWADLVSWVVDMGSIRRVSPWSPRGYSCRQDFEQNGCCYCGKLRRANGGAS